MIVTYTHKFSAGHRIVGHPGECRMIHGHNYTVRFSVEGEVRDDGMVVDFADIKKTYGHWIDRTWDHRLLLWDEDPIASELIALLQRYETLGSVVTVPFNPTAENMALHLYQLSQRRRETLVYPVLSSVEVQETDKCSAIC